VEYSTTTLGRGRKPAVLLAPAFTFFVPGRVIVTNWTRMASWSRVAMPTVLSLSRLTLVATIALWAHAWKPMDLFQVEAWVSLAGLCFDIPRRNRHRLDDGARPRELRARRNMQ
jgi:hypothetical protein